MSVPLYRACPSCGMHINLCYRCTPADVDAAKEKARVLAARTQAEQTQDVLPGYDYDDAAVGSLVESHARSITFKDDSVLVRSDAGTWSTESPPRDLFTRLKLSLEATLTERYGPRSAWPDVNFYTPEDWFQRCTGGQATPHPPIGAKALLTMTYEGPVNHDINECKLDAAMDAISAQLDLYYERGYSWSLHFYPCRV